MSDLDDVTTSGAVARDVADAVLALPGVAGLSGGRFGAIGTYLPGGRVVGVALHPDSGEVAIVGELGYDLHAVAERVRRTAVELTGLPIDVTIADLNTADLNTADLDTADLNTEEPGTGEQQ